MYATKASIPLGWCIIKKTRFHCDSLFKKEQVPVVTDIFCEFLFPQYRLSWPYLISPTRCSKSGFVCNFFICKGIRLHFNCFGPFAVFCALHPSLTSFINAKYFPLFVVPNSNSCQSVGNSVFWYFTWGFEEQKVPQAQQNFCSLMGTLLRNIFGTFATYFHWNKLVIFRCTSTLWERSILFCLCLCMKIQFNSLIFIMFNKLWAFNFAFGKNVQALLFENISDGKATSLCFMTRHQNKSNFFFFAFAWTFSSLHFDILTFQIL